MPIDDENTLSVGWFFDRVPNEMRAVHAGPHPVLVQPDHRPRTGRWITTHVMNQDFVGLGRPGRDRRPDAGAPGRERPRHHHDAQALLEQAELVARGGEPKAVIRDPAENACVGLPIIGREYFVSGYSDREEHKRRERTPGSPRRKEFPFLTGQPEEIRAAFRRAMGLDAEVPRDVRSPG